MMADPKDNMIVAPGVRSATSMPSSAAAMSSDLANEGLVRRGSATTTCGSASWSCTRKN